MSLSKSTTRTRILPRRLKKNSRISGARVSERPLCSYVLKLKQQSISSSFRFSKAQTFCIRVKSRSFIYQNLRAVYDKNGAKMTEKEGGIGVDDAAGFFANVFGGERFQDYVSRQASALMSLTSFRNVLLL